MSDKMKVRQGEDGYVYPYTSPDLVVDKNGKSNTSKFNEIDAQFKNIANLFFRKKVIKWRHKGVKNVES